MAKQKKRADGRYCKNITIGRNENGSLKRKMIYANTQKELELKVAELTLQVDKGCVINDKGMTVDVWANKWFETYKSSYKPNTTKTYKSLINKYIEPNFKNIRLKDLKQFQIKKVLNDIEQTNKTTSKTFLSAINQMLDTAVENDYISKNVAKGLKLSRFELNSKEPLTNEQINIIKNTDDEMQNICLFLIYSGLRINELMNLTWSNVDFKNKLIYIRGDVKTKASIRNIPIVNPLYNLLKSIDNNRIKNIDAEKDYIFIFKRKNGFIDIYYKNMLLLKRKKFCAKCGFDFTYHQLRHTYASLLYYAGVDIKQAQEWLGHNSAQITLDIYTHLQEKGKITATNKIDDYLKTI